jgi:hypothetical protein
MEQKWPRQKTLILNQGRWKSQSLNKIHLGEGENSEDFRITAKKERRRLKTEVSGPKVSP